MNTERLIEIIVDAGYEVRKDYSGRGMYGAECVGFAVDSERAILVAIAEMMASASDDDEREALVDVFRRAYTDSMGRGMIVYFPKMRTA